MANSTHKTPQTEDDLRDIWRYISDRNAKAADAVLDRIERTFEMLAEYPRSGIARPELASGLRSFPSDGYVVFSVIRADGIDVVRVMHAHRDITAKDMPSVT